MGFPIIIPPLVLKQWILFLLLVLLLRQVCLHLQQHLFQIVLPVRNRHPILSLLRHLFPLQIFGSVLHKQPVHLLLLVCLYKVDIRRPYA